MSSILVDSKAIKKNIVDGNIFNLQNTKPVSRTELSIYGAINRIVNEIDEILKHGYSYGDVVSMLSNSVIDNVIGDDHLLSIESVIETEVSAATNETAPMVSYNDSNRSLDHQTRWNCH
jgi:hypothetical protein